MQRGYSITGPAIQAVILSEGQSGEVIFDEDGPLDETTTFRLSGLGFVAVETDGQYSIRVE